MLIAENVDLSRYSTSLNGLARWMIEANKQQLPRAIGFAQKQQAPWVVVPSGTNVPWDSNYFEGVVIILQS